MDGERDERLAHPVPVLPVRPRGLRRHLDPERKVRLDMERPVFRSPRKVGRTGRTDGNHGQAAV